jgi:O-antigen ligase
VKKTTPKRTRGPRSPIDLTQDSGGYLRDTLFWACLAVLIVVPLVFDVSAYRIFVFPKFAALLVGSSLVLCLLLLLGRRVGIAEIIKSLRSGGTLLVGLLLVPITASTFLGVEPLGTFWGSPSAQMGLLSRLCFVVVFLGLIVGIEQSRDRLRQALWAMAATGIVAALYAFVQFVGRDPFLPSRLYTSMTPNGPVTRVLSTLGHSNYLGNLLMYTTPITLGLAVVAAGRSRRIAALGVLLSVAGVAFSGTRGAWLGLVPGAAVFVLFIARDWTVSRLLTRSNLIRGTAILVVVTTAAIIIVLSPASRSIGLRARTFVGDRFTGSGRTLLWRDSLKMVASFPLVGCGPEGFTRAFPPFKSEELARLSPDTIDESSHNSFLDAAVSFGFSGAILYAAILAAAVVCIMRSARDRTDSGMKPVAAGLLAAAAAVSTHNLFIYDQIPTGLYFFVLIALAISYDNVNRANRMEEHEKLEPKVGRVERLLWSLSLATSVALFVSAGWYCIAGLQAEAAIKDALSAGRAGDFERLVSSGQRAVSRGPDPTKPYHALFARALADYVQVTRRDSRQSEDQADLQTLGKRAAEMGIEYGEIGAAHSLTPVADFSVLAYLELSLRNVSRARSFAQAALRYDPTYYRGHLLLGKAEFLDGNREAAIREARAALRLKPGWGEATALLSRAGRDDPEVKMRIQTLIQRADGLSKAGSARKAETLLARAISASTLPCPECLKALAELYEKVGRTAEAIQRWNEYSQTASGSEREFAARKVVELSGKRAEKK